MMKNFTLNLILFTVLLFTVGQSYAGIVVSGKITNRNDIPVDGAEILYDNNVVSISQEDGTFTMELPDNAKRIAVRSKGYLDYYTKVAGNSYLEITLDKDVTIKTSYFNIAQNSFNGSASSLRGDDITGIPTGQVGNAWTGRLNGLVTTQYSGNPGNDGVTYFIRGRRTNADGPLVLIDGLPGVVRDLSAFDIESVTILKDASATALYGMRASNGVILVNSKRGENGKMKVDFSAQAGYQGFTRSLNRVDAATFAEMYNEAMYNEDPNATPRYLDTDIQKYRDGSSPITHPNINWYDDLLRKGTWLQKYNVNVSGGNENTRYFVSLGAQLQSGMFKTDDDFSYSTNTEYQKYNFRSNVDFKATPSTFIGVGLAMRYEKRNAPGLSLDNQGNILRALINTPPNAFPKYYLDDGTYVDNTGNQVVGVNGKIVAGSPEDVIRNPWAMINRAGYSIHDRRYGSVNVNALQKLDFITDGLSLDINLATDINSDQFVIRNKSYANYELMPDGTLFMRGTDGKMANASSGAMNTRKTAFDASLGYSNRFGKHSVSGSFFYSLIEETNDYVLPTRYHGIGAMASYGYDNRYFGDLTFSYQGSNKLPSNNRYAPSWAFSAGWLVTNENFMKSVDAVSHLKLRASVGQVASARAIGYYEYLDALTKEGGVMNEGTGSISSKPGYDETKAGNHNLKWEKSTQWDIGIDAGFLSNKLWLTADYFQDRRRDMYMQPTTYSLIAGASRIPYANVGKMKSSGYEISVSWQDRAGDLGYSITVNYAQYKNKIVDFDEPVYEYAHMYKKGHGIDDIYGLVADGYYKNQADINNSKLPNFASVMPGDIKYRSLSGLSEIDATYDVTRIAGGTTPRIFYSSELGLAYKGFNINVLFQGAAKVNRVLSGPLRNTFVDQGSFLDFQLDRWKDENSGNPRYPRLSTESNPNSDRTSTHWVRNASYLRLKNAEIGYTFNKPFKGKVEKIKLFLSGYNLALIHDSVKIIDPEASGDGYSYPVPRTFNFGVNVSF